MKLSPRNTSFIPLGKLDVPLRSEFNISVAKYCTHYSKTKSAVFYG